MMALVVMAVFALYLLVAVLVVRAAVRAARRRGIAGWKWGLPAALAMYLLVFWDHVPTLLAHRYYCQRHAGLTVHKTPEQWRAENPGVAATLSWKELSDRYRGDPGVTGFVLNERIRSETRQRRLRILPVTISYDRIVDSATNEILVERVRVGSGYGSMAVGGSGDWRVVKFWVGGESCLPKGFGILEQQYKRIGES